jgi:hypothetical protein
VVLYFYVQKSSSSTIQDLLKAFVNVMILNRGKIPNNFSRRYNVDRYRDTTANAKDGPRTEANTEKYGLAMETNAKFLRDGLKELTKGLRRFWTIIDAIEGIEKNESLDVRTTLYEMTKFGNCRLLVSVTDQHLKFLHENNVFDKRCPKIATDVEFPGDLPMQEVPTNAEVSPQVGDDTARKDEQERGEEIAGEIEEHNDEEKESQAGDEAEGAGDGENGEHQEGDTTEDVGDEEKYQEAEVLNCQLTDEGRGDVEEFFFEQQQGDQGGVIEGLLSDLDAIRVPNGAVSAMLLNEGESTEEDLLN